VSSGGPSKGSSGHRPVLGVRRDPRRSPAERTKAFDAAPATVPQRRVIGTATSPLGHDLGPQTSGLPAFRSARLKCRYPARSGCPRFAVLGKRPCVEHPKGMDGSHFTRGACQTAGPCLRAGAACTVYCPGPAGRAPAGACRKRFNAGSRDSARRNPPLSDYPAVCFTFKWK
jgi:hypothetical protein